MIKPYLSIRDRISQAWINRYTILLTLVALKLILFHNSLRNSLKLVQQFTIDSCPTVDSFASNAVSIPHYLSKSANYMILKSIEEINDKTKETLKLILTGTENLIIFAIDMIVGTYACVLVSTIDGAVDVAVNSTEHIISWVNDTLIEITDEIEDGLEDLSTVINKVVSTADKVADFFTDDDDDEDDTSESFNKVSLTISGLKNLHIPSSINDKLESLRENTPDFETVRNKTEELIRTPFDLVKLKIDNSTFVADDESNKLYVPPIVGSNICSENTDMINDFYNEVNNDILKLVKILVAVLLVCALIVLIPIIWEEFRKWKKLQNLEKHLDENKDPIESYEAAFNKYPTSIGLAISKISNNEKNKLTIRWIMSYFLSNRSLIVFGIGIAGIIAVVLQFLMLFALNNSIDNNKAPFDSMTQNLTIQLDNSVKNWTNSTNDFINDKEFEINDELFSWVKTTTNAVNNTIAEFVEEMNGVISDAFGDTILYGPVKTIVGCVIESKLLKIEQGLTWVYDNAEITLPKVNDNYITSGFSSSNDSSTTDLVSKSQELVSKTEDMMISLLNSTIAAYKKTLMFELYIALSIIGIWLLQLAIAIIVGLLDNRFGSNDDFYGFDETKWNISKPRQLTQAEQIKYNYPFTRPSSVRKNFANPIATNITKQPNLHPAIEKEANDYNQPQNKSSSSSSESLDTIDSSFPFNLNLQRQSAGDYYNENDWESSISDLFESDAKSRILGAMARP